MKVHYILFLLLFPSVLLAQQTTTGIIRTRKLPLMIRQGPSKSSAVVRGSITRVYKNQTVLIPLPVTIQNNYLKILIPETKTTAWVTYSYKSRPYIEIKQVEVEVEDREPQSEGSEDTTSETLTSDSESTFEQVMSSNLINEGTKYTEGKVTTRSKGLRLKMQPQSNSDSIPFNLTTIEKDSSIAVIEPLEIINNHIKIAIPETPYFAWVTYKSRGGRKYVTLNNESIEDPEVQVPVNNNSQSSTTTNNHTFAWTGKHKNAHKWAGYVDSALESVGTNLIDGGSPKDINNYCPNYNNLNRSNRKIFWTQLISKMAQYESNFKPQTSYTESFTNSNGQRIVSRGLLQLSNESAKGYRCKHQNAQGLHNEKINLTCTVRIMSHWFKRTSKIKSGTNKGAGDAYWAVIRKSSINNKIKKYTKNLGICK